MVFPLKLFRSDLPGQRSWRSRRQIVLLALTSATLTVGLVALGSYQFLRTLLLNNLQQQALLQVRLSSDDIDQWLAIRKNEVVTLARTPQVQSLSWAVAGPYLKREVAQLPELFAFMLAFPDGSYYHTKVNLAQFKVKDREWFIQAMAGNPITVADPVISRTTGVPQINISSPIRLATSSSPRGVFSSSIKVNRVVEVVDKLKLGPESYAFALNSQGAAIAHPNPALISTKEKPAPSLLQADNPDLVRIVRQMVNHQTGIELVQLDGTWKYIAYVPLDEARWSLALVMPREAIEANLGALNLLASVVGSLLLIAIGAVWWQVQTLEQTRTQAEQEALLNRLTNRIRHSLELKDILHTTVTELAALRSLDRVLFSWYDPASQRLEISSDSAQPEAQSVSQFQSEGLPDLVDCLQQGATVCLNATDSEAKSLSLVSGRYLALAISTAHERCGYLIVQHQKDLSSDNRALLQAVTDQLAIAITQATLYNQTQSQVQLLNDTLTRLNQTQLQLVQTEKMSSLGQLVAGVAHEINNPVNFINGNLSHASEYTHDLLQLIQLYQTHYPQPAQPIQLMTEAIELEFLSADLPKLLASMQVGTQRIQEIVQSLRIFSRLDESEVKNVDLHEGIDSTLMILQNRLKARPDQVRIEVVKHYGPLPLVECYAGQLNQVFMNLLSNAIDALEEVRADRPSPPPRIQIQTQVLDPQTVTIAIADNGPGIAPEVQSKIFDPFFTTKEVGKGTGMGLAISYQIVTEKHGGQLRCHSTLGQGTEFILEIPIQPSRGGSVNFPETVKIEE